MFQRLLGQAFAQFEGGVHVGGRDGAADINALGAIFREHPPSQAQGSAGDMGVSSDGQGTTTLQHAEECALGCGGEHGGRVGERGKEIQGIALVEALDGEGALTGGAQHLGCGERFADVFRQAQALQAGGGQHDGIELLAGLAQFGEAGGHVAADGQDLEIGAEGEQLGAATQAARADARGRGQLGEGRAGAADQGIPVIAPPRHGGQGKVRGQVDRQVFQAVHGAVDFTAAQSFFQGFGEQAFAADGG